MSAIHETLTRQWHMLRHIPRAPVQTTTSQLGKLLAADGYSTTPRTIQRDLQELVRTGVFSLREDRKSKPHGWSWAKEGTPFHAPSLSTSDALLLQMVEQHLLALLPANMVSELLPQFEASAQRLQAALGAKRHRWLDLVRVIPPTQYLKGPEVMRSVRTAVYQALLDEHRVQIQYQRRGARNAASYEVNPLGVVLRGPVTYVVGSVGSYPDVRLFAMHRIRSARELQKPLTRPAEFDFDRYLRSGGLDFGRGTSIKLKARFYDGTGDHLRDQRLSLDQDVVDCGDHSVQVSATVPDTPQLRWWLMGFGAGVEVLGPATLRAEFAESASNLKARYARPPANRKRTTLKPGGKDGKHAQGH